MVENLLDYLEKNPTWKLHGFLRACHVTNQNHVISLLGLEPLVYDQELTSIKDNCNQHGQKVHFYKGQGTGKLVQIPRNAVQGNSNLSSEIFEPTRVIHALAI